MQYKPADADLFHSLCKLASAGIAPSFQATPLPGPATLRRTIQADRIPSQSESHRASVALALAWW
jgi:hypothetical protein